MIEDAIISILTTAGLNSFGTLYKGHDPEERDGNHISVVCFGGPEIVYNSGNYLEKVRITVRSRADQITSFVGDDTRGDHQKIVQLVREALHVQGIETTLSATQSTWRLLVNLFYPTDSEASVEGRRFVTVLEYECDAVAYIPA